MGILQPPDPVLKFCAIFAQKPESLEWARQRLEEQWGKIVKASPEFDFSETTYYQAEMGAGLKKQLLVFEGLEPPEWLPTAKLQSNQWEQDYRDSFPSEVERPLNIDPGYVTLAKLVLATTKDRDHRLYLGQGIFGEVTVHFKHGQWQNDRWTYPDFQRTDFQSFLTECREYLKLVLKGR